MTRGRIKGDHEAKRIEIAGAAYKVFLRHGLERTSLADIAREIGKSTGVLRHYFADKDELLLFAKNFIFDQAYDRAKAAANGVEDAEKLRTIIFELLPLSPESISRYRLLAMFNGSAIGDSRLMRMQAKRDIKHAELLAELIEGMQNKRLVRDDLNPQVEAAVLLALLDGLSEQLIMRPNALSRNEIISIFDRQLNFLTPQTR